jgi:subtilisin family serine protease
MSEVRSIAILGMGTMVLGILFTEPLAGGETGGVGIQLAVQEGWPTILDVAEGAPAARAGLRPGDRIVKINGQTTREMPFAQVVARLIGPVGEKVTLTIQRRQADKISELDAPLTRAVLRPRMPTLAKLSAPAFTPTKEVQKVEWHGNRIVSRVLPYPDLVSLLARLPLAHAAVTGQGVRVALVQRSEGDGISSVLRLVAPGAEIRPYARAGGLSVERLTAGVREAGCRVAVIPDVDLWPEQDVVALAKGLPFDKVVVVVPSDLSEDPDKIRIINSLQSQGVLAVGRLNSQSTVMGPTADSTIPFNRQIRTIATDVFATVESRPSPDPRTPAVTAAGVAALVLERWPNLSGAEVRRKIIDSARPAWQGTCIETGRWSDCRIDPVTTRYTPIDEKAVFRFRVLDAAAAVDVDTEVPWFLNMLNCQKAWEITKGRGAVAVVTDSGFHVRHPDLAGHIGTTRHFGARDFNSPDQHFHGTEMSRILLAIAPEAKIIPALCEDLRNMEQLAPHVTQSFELALELKAAVISSSWSARLNKDEALLAAIRKAAAGGVVVSWFHYPESSPGILRPLFAYAYGSQERRLSFSDRFLINPPAFHPIEIESGLSNTAPQAAGLAALAKSVNPALTPQEIEKLLFDNSDPIGETILVPDAFRLVQAAQMKRPG